MWSDYFRVWLNVSRKINTSWTFSTWFNSLGKVTCKMYCSFFFSFINKNVLKDIEAPTGWVNDSRRACSRPWSLDISFGVLFVPILDEVTFRILSWWQGTNLGAIATSWTATHPNFSPAFNPKNWGGMDKAHIQFTEGQNCWSASTLGFQPHGWFYSAFHQSPSMMVTAGATGDFFVTN